VVGVSNNYKSKIRSCIYPVILYLLGAGLTLKYALFDFVIKSDSAEEYGIYQVIIRDGYTLKKGLLDSCLSTTLFPAFLHNISGIEPLLLYKTYTCFIIPLLPVVCYFIFQRITNKHLAFFVALYVIAQPYFLWSPSLARINMALLFYALAVLIYLRSSKINIRSATAIMLCAIGMVVSHYGVSYVALGIFIFTWLLKRLSNYIPKLKTKIPKIGISGICVCGLIIGISIWYIGITDSPAHYGKQVAFVSLQETIGEREVVAIENPNVTPSEEIPVNIEIPPDEGTVSSIFNLKSRSPVIQVAFGMTLGEMNIAQKIEFVLSWLLIILMTYGLYYHIRYKFKENKLYIIPAIISYILILITIAIPHLSNTHGISKIYYQAIMVLAVFIVVSCSKLAETIKIPSVLIAALIIGPYMLCTTGALHHMLGYTR